MITKVEITLDDNVPEYMNGIIRCGSVVSYDENDQVTNYQQFIDNTEYHSEAECVKDISDKLKVSDSIVEIVA